MQRRLRRTMRLELGLMGAVIVATGFLTQLPAPSGALESDFRKDRSAEFSAVRADVAAEVAISPNVVGFNEWEISLSDRDGAPLENPVEQLRVRFRYDDPAVGPVTVAAQPMDDRGRFSLSGAYFGLPGLWNIELELRRATGERFGAVGGVACGVGLRDGAAVRHGSAGSAESAVDADGLEWGGSLWAFTIGLLALINRRHLRDRLGARAGDAALAAGGVGVILAIVLMTGLEVEPGRTVVNPVVLTEESIARGATLYAANCTTCHGEQGAGDGPLAETLPAPPANFTVHVPFHPDGVLFTWISDGIRGTGMPAWSPSLSEAERWDLVNFLRAMFDPGAAVSAP